MVKHRARLLPPAEGETGLVLRNYEISYRKSTYQVSNKAVAGFRVCGARNARSAFLRESWLSERAAVRTDEVREEKQIREDPLSHQHHKAEEVARLADLCGEERSRQLDAARNVKEGTNLHERQEMHPLVLGLFQQGADPSSIAAECRSEGQLAVAVKTNKLS